MQGALLIEALLAVTGAQGKSLPFPSWQQSIAEVVAGIDHRACLVVSMEGAAGYSFGHHSVGCLLELGSVHGKLQL